MSLLVYKLLQRIRSKMVKEEECLKKGVCEEKRSGSFINPVCLQVGEKRRAIDREERIGWRYGDSLDHEVGRCWKGRVSAGKWCHTQRLLKRVSEKSYLQQMGKVERNQEEMTQYPSTSKSREPLPLPGWRGKRGTWGDKCMERFPWQEHRQVTVTWEKGSVTLFPPSHLCLVFPISWTHSNSPYMSACWGSGWRVNLEVQMETPGPLVEKEVL